MGMVIGTGNVNGYTNSINKCFYTLGGSEEVLLNAVKSSKLNLSNIFDNEIRNKELVSIARKINSSISKVDSSRIKLIVGGKNPTCYSYATLLSAVIAILGGNPQIVIGTDSREKPPSPQFATHVWCEFEGFKLDYQKPENYFPRKIIKMTGEVELIA